MQTRRNHLFFGVISALALGYFSASALADTAAPRAASAVKTNVHTEIDRCGNNLTCVAHALATAIEANSGGGGGGGGTGEVVYFYHSDSCQESELIRPIRIGIPASSCERLGQAITTRVWAVRFPGGACSDISDADFTDACMRYAAE